MKCNFCLEKTATVNLSDEYDIIILGSIHEDPWACEECHQKFKDNKGILVSKKGFTAKYSQG